MRNRIFQKSLLLLAFVFIAPLITSAGESVPISVIVAIEVNALTSSWTSADKEEVLATSRQLLVTSLKTKHPHWDFRNDGADRFCSIKLRVVDPEPGNGKHEAEVRLEVTPGDNDDHWPSYDWLNPVDFQFRRFPNAQSMAAKLTEIIKNQFLEDRRVDFRKWLQETIPLAKSGEWRNRNTAEPNFHIVLSLPYETFEDLKASLFQIKGKPVEGPVEKLRALGISTPGVFPPRPGRGEYQGLVVQARSIEGDGQILKIEPRVLEFRLGPVFLLNEVKPREQELALFEEDGS